MTVNQKLRYLFKKCQAVLRYRCTSCNLDVSGLTMQFRLQCAFMCSGLGCSGVGNAWERHYQTFSGVGKCPRTFYIL